MTATRAAPAAPRPALPVLTSLRFFAASEVVVFHQAPVIHNRFLHGLASVGYDAVTFFFVLSGFILTYVYSGESEGQAMTGGAGAFWSARLVRIAPAYYFGLLVLLPRFVYTALVSKIMSLSALFTGLVLVPTFLQAWWPPAALLWNAPAWSLSAEFFFYLLFPALTVLAARMSRYWFLSAAGGLVIAMSALRFQVLPDGPPDSALHNFIWFSPIFHLPHFLFGMALGRLFLFGLRLPTLAHAVMMYAGLVATTLVFGLGAAAPAWIRSDPVLVALFGLIILGGARGHVAIRPLTWPFLVLLGDASYSVYILHIPVAFWWGWMLAHTPGLPGPWSGFLFYFAVTVVISILFFLYVESPLRRRLRGVWGGKLASPNPDRELDDNQSSRTLSHRVSANATDCLGNGVGCRSTDAVTEFQMLKGAISGRGARGKRR